MQVLAAFPRVKHYKASAAGATSGKRSLDAGTYLSTSPMKAQPLTTCRVVANNSEGTYNVYNIVISLRVLKYLRAALPSFYETLYRVCSQRLYFEYILSLSIL
jgi:hypothetical protein